MGHAPIEVSRAYPPLLVRARSSKRPTAGPPYIPGMDKMDRGSYRLAHVAALALLAALGGAGSLRASDTAWRAPADAARLFDHFVGAWDFECDFYAPDGTRTQFPGEWSFAWVLDGRAMQDIWVGYLRGRAPGQRGMGTSVRFLDTKSQQWRVVFVAPEGGKILTLKGGGVGDRIVLEGLDADGSMLRWSFNDVRQDSFLWRGETSADGGKTWRVEQIMRLRRRPVAHAG